MVKPTDFGASYSCYRHFCASLCWVVLMLEAASHLSTQVDLAQWAILCCGRIYMASGWLLHQSKLIQWGNVLLVNVPNHFVACKEQQQVSTCWHQFESAIFSVARRCIYITECRKTRVTSSPFVCQRYMEKSLPWPFHGTIKSQLLHAFLDWWLHPCASLGYNPPV